MTPKDNLFFRPARHKILFGAHGNVLILIYFKIRVKKYNHILFLLEILIEKGPMKVICLWSYMASYSIVLFYT